MGKIKIKTNKTAAKRFRKTNPRGGKGKKILFNKSHQNHGFTKRSARTKNRTLRSNNVSDSDKKRVSKLI
ncbi:50S ribosomal protein L35 [Candidatus Dojkabacteria bacterium]|nr:50S ribosomal protein L35 [Candidatus Dojkabacteria bacterium]